MKVIHHRSWIDRELCDTIYLPEFDGETPTTPPKSGIIYCPLDQIADFFRVIEKTDNKYVVVSACSDYGVAIQQQHPVGNDMQKWFPMCDVSGVGYGPAIVPPRCNVERCKVFDKYSVKMYSFTRDTFNKTPKNILCWYLTNGNVATHDLGTPQINIPFGIGNNEVDITQYYQSLDKKEDKIYFNFTNNTNERLELKRMYRHHPKAYFAESLPYEEYLQDMASSKYVMCPPGNGLDSYRIWEALYVGSIPIVPGEYWSQFLQEYPVALMPHHAIDENTLLESYSLIEKKYGNDWRQHPVWEQDLNYDWWRDQIKQDGEQI